MEILIGKSEICDYKINEQFVSREHCKFIAQNEIYYVIDLNSTNGTFINGVRIKPNERVLVEEGAEIMLAANYKLDWKILARYIPTSNFTVRLSEDQLKANIRSPELKQQEEQYKKEDRKPQYRNDRENYNRHQGLGSEVTYALHSNKSYVGSAFLTWIMYYLGFGIVGLIMNIAYLSSAGKTKQIINRNPPGYGCLVFLLVIHLIVPAILLILASLAGVSLFEYISDIF